MLVARNVLETSLWIERKEELILFPFIVFLFMIGVNDGKCFGSELKLVFEMANGFWLMLLLELFGDALIVLEILKIIG